MRLEIRIGEGSGVLLLFFLWLLVGFELLIYVSTVVGFLYVIVSKAVLGSLNRSPRGIRIIKSHDVEMSTEKHYSLGQVSVIVLKGPVKVTAWRTAIGLGTICAGLALPLLFLAFTSAGDTVAGSNAVFVGVLILVIVMNLLEVRWRTTDARQ